MSEVTAAPLLTLTAPQVNDGGVCGADCIGPGWLHLQQITNLIFMMWAVATSFTLLSTLRTWVTGERNLFGIIPVTEETVDRVIGVQYWFATHGKWFMLVFSSCLLQLVFFIQRFEEKKVAGIQSTLEIFFGAFVTIEFLAALIHAMFSPFAVAMVECITRFPIDITIIISSFALGRIGYDTQEQVDALTVPENTEVTSVQPKTWYVPTYFIVFRLMYVWRRWFSSLPVANSVFYRILRGINFPIVAFPIVFVAAMSIAVFEEVGFDARWYLKGPPLEEDRYAVLTQRAFADPYDLGGGMPFFQYGKLWAPLAGGDAIPERDFKKAFNLLWTPLSTAYFYLMSLLTIGPGDLSPATIAGRLLTLGSLPLGITAMMKLIREARRLYKMMLEGKQAYIQKRGVKHIVVTGTPCFQQIQDFVTEMYHEEKMVLPYEAPRPAGIDDLVMLVLVSLYTPPPVSAEFEAPPTGLNTETVILLEDPVTCEKVRVWLNKRENLKYRSRVFVYNGSVWDGLIPSKAYDALMIFVLPNLYTEDMEKDDQSNVMRHRLLSRLSVNLRIVVLLHVSEKKDLLSSAGVAEQYLVSLDDFKASIAMKSCFLPGFACFICNLFKTVAPSFAAKTETAQPDAFMPWEKMYFSGLEKEIYELDLSKAYYGLSFGEIVLDILHRSEGEVLMIGIVEYGLGDLPNLKLNPGAGERMAPWVFDPNYRDSPQLAGRKLKGVFIAPDVAAVAQKFYLPGQDDVGLKYREQQQALASGAAKAKAREQQFAAGAGGGNARLAALEKKRARKLEEQEQSRLRNINRNMTLKEKIRAAKSGDLAQLYVRVRVQLQFQFLAKVLALGGHMILCCLGSRTKCQVRIYPAIRTLRLHSKAPLVILSQAVPPDWHRVLEAKGIYMLAGNPMDMFDLKRTNFEHASCIVILVGSAGKKKRGIRKESAFRTKQVEDFRELYRSSSSGASAQFVADTYKAPPNMNMVDADGIFCCKLIEDNLPPLSTTTADMAAHRAALLRQPRYCSGRLFCSSMITSLMVNILYNTSLVALVKALMMCKGATVDVPANWVGMPLLNFMESLMWHHNLIPVGIARLIKHEKAEKRKKFNPNELPPPPKLRRESTHFSKHDSAMKELTKDIEPRFIMSAPHAMDELLHLGDILVCIAKYDVTDQDVTL
eukprot:g13700.t1